MGKKKRFRVSWSKTYHATGEIYVDAASKREAERIVHQKIGDYEGSMQYDADDDEVEAQEVE